MRHRSRATARSRHIAMVAACPFPSPRGSQVLILELAEALVDRGHTVHLVTYSYGESLVPVRGILMHRVSRPRFIDPASGPSWRKVILDLYLMRTLYRVVRREGIDVIHAHNYEAPLVGYLVRWLTGTPVVYHSHNALSDELAYYFKAGWPRRLARYVGRWLDRQVPKRADFSIALTPELEEFLHAQGVGSDRLTTIPPAIAPHGRIETPQAEPGRVAGRFVVMYTGNLDPYQDLDVLCDGFAAFQRVAGHALLVVVTHDHGWATWANGRLAALVREGQAQVVVAAAFAVVRRQMARADVLVCPRGSWSGFPIKLINYLAAGRAVIAAEGSGKWVVPDETGLIFRNRDAGGLASALVRVWSDPGLRQRLGDNARMALANAPGWEHAVTQVEAVYTRVCGNRIRPRCLVQGAQRGRMRGLIAFSRDRISATSGERPV